MVYSKLLTIGSAARNITPSGQQNVFKSLLDPSFLNTDLSISLGSPFNLSFLNIDLSR